MESTLNQSPDHVPLRNLQAVEKADYDRIIAELQEERAAHAALRARFDSMLVQHATTMSAFTDLRLNFRRLRQRTTLTISQGAQLLRIQGEKIDALRAHIRDLMEENDAQVDELLRQLGEARMQKV
uniref:Uncharacterized protein n=1 Tax=Mycena chlorophos TaxID=658473 RepID=A0ABQ0L208_MYCCL|nr:predicted protein [Mycena chlorophos]